MLKNITNIPIEIGLIKALSKIPSAKGTICGKIALAGVYTIDALGLIWVKNKVLDNTLIKRES